MIVIADTTPIISLLKINHLEILHSLYGTVHIPLAVYKELTENSDFPEEARIIENCDFLEVHTDIESEKVDFLRRATGLDLGESEAIVLADSQDSKTLLIDERHGRTVARNLEIPITGVIGVLLAAYKKEFLSANEIRESIAIMKNSNRFISESLYEILLSELED